MTTDESLVQVDTITAPRSIYRNIQLAGAVAAIPFSFAPFVLLRFEILGGSGRDLFLVLLPGMLLLVPVHEGIHWLAARLSGAPADSCGFGFARGFPYFRARVPLPVRRYRAVLLAPGVSMTVVAAFLAWSGNNFAWAVLAGVALTAGIGDYYWFWRLRRIASDRWVQDPPGLVGVEILARPES